jgi:hypothetical protein
MSFSFDIINKILPNQKIKDCPNAGKDVRISTKNNSRIFLSDKDIFLLTIIERKKHKQTDILIFEVE